MHRRDVEADEVAESVLAGAEVVQEVGEQRVRLGLRQQLAQCVLLQH